MKIQDIYASIGNYGCLLLCYLNEANIDVNITKYFNELVELDIIDNCTSSSKYFIMLTSIFASCK